MMSIVRLVLTPAEGRMLGVLLVEVSERYSRDKRVVGLITRLLEDIANQVPPEIIGAIVEEAIVKTEQAVEGEEGFDSEV